MSQQPAQDARAALGALLSGTRQQQRLLKLHFPRDDGPAALLLANRLEASEGLSRDFHFAVELLSDKPDIELKTMLGKMVSIELLRDDGRSPARWFNGFVFEFRFVRNEGGFAFYDMLLLPWLALARLRRDNRLFHGLSVEAQSDKVLSAYAERDWRCERLGEDPAMTDACQFDESDYNYLHRRWEALGWHYWYEHRRDGHTLVLSGDSTGAAAIEGGPEVPWQGEHHGSGVRRLGVQSLTPVRALSSTLYSAASFDFKTPRPLHQNTPTLNQQGDVPGMLEVYEYSGAYGFKNAEAGQAFVRLRMEEIEAAAKHFVASADYRGLQPGRFFTLTGHVMSDPLSFASGSRPEPDDTQFLLTELRHSASNNYETHQGQPAEYHCQLHCLRKKIPWRPGRGMNSSEPRIYGLQTAIVVGPPGEEIHCDEHGRVRVQFHWDREGGYDDRSSAWVRVASSFAGSGFGFMAVPRIGQEVLVQFLDGNPDRPLITGRVYNQQNMPPWELPANKTQTGLLSRSTKGGSPANANAIRFEDKKGAEELWLHAEKDQRIEVENDESHWVGRDRSKTIDRHETVQVKGHRTETVDLDESITVHQNRQERVDLNETISIGKNRKEDVGENESISIGASRTKTVARNETDKIGKSWSIKVGKTKTETITLASMQNVGLGKMVNVGAAYSLNVGMAMNTLVGLSQSAQIGMSKSTRVGKSYSIDAGDEFSVTVGAASLVLKSDGTVLINGKKFHFSCSGAVQIDGDIDLN